MNHLSNSIVTSIIRQPFSMKEPAILYIICTEQRSLTLQFVMISFTDVKFHTMMLDGASLKVSCSKSTFPEKKDFADHCFTIGTQMVLTGVSVPLVGQLQDGAQMLLATGKQRTTSLLANIQRTATMA